MPQIPKKPKLTHFLCLLLVTPTSRPQLQSSIARFVAQVTAPSHDNNYDDDDVYLKAIQLPAKAIRPVGSIHLTIGVMSLLTPDRVEAACAYLKSLDIRGILSAAAAEADAGVSGNAIVKDDSNTAKADPDISASSTTVPPPPLSPSSAAAATQPETMLDAPTPPPQPPNIHPTSPSPPPRPLIPTLTGLHAFGRVHRTSSLHRDD